MKDKIIQIEETKNKILETKTKKSHNYYYSPYFKLNNTKTFILSHTLLSIYKKYHPIRFIILHFFEQEIEMCREFIQIKMEMN